MSEVFMGQVMMTGFPYAPKGFAQCNGGMVSVPQYQALYALLGTTYGGNGTQTFGLPDLRGRTPAGGFLSQSTSWQPTPYPMGAILGQETVTLTPDQNGPHTHGLIATTGDASTGVPDGSQILAQSGSTQGYYAQPTNLVPLGGGPSTAMGGSVPHSNIQPFAVINFNIALTGIFPTRG